MSISRRSFLKMAGLTTVAVAGASLFSSCSLAPELSMTLVEITEGSKVTNRVTGWTNGKKEIGSAAIPGLGLVVSNWKFSGAECKDYIRSVLKEDLGSKNYQSALAGKDIEIWANGRLVSDSSYLYVDKKDSSHYALTITFKIVKA